jgi:polyhydroxybutyrate depolymerase
LAILLHGGSGTGGRMSRLAEFDAAADRHGYLLAFPDGVDEQWADGRGKAAPEKAGVDDVRFIADLIARLVAEGKADPRRVYVAGISNGGMMSQRLGCDLSEQVAAFASVAANLPTALAARCRPNRPVRAAFVLGTNDPFMPFAGGDVLSAAESVAFWVRLNQCQAPPQTQTVERRQRRDDTRVQSKSWNHCRSGSAVLDVTVEGGGHTWPGGRQYLAAATIGPTSRQLEATELLFEFFPRFSR